MAETWLILLLIMIAGLLLRVAWRPALILEYPYFIAGVFAVFILPQAFSLVRFKGAVSYDAISDVILMSCLCLGAAVMGYRISPSNRVLIQASRQVNETRIGQVGLVFLICGFLFSYLLGRVEIKVADSGGMTGIATIYLFFAGLGFHGLAIFWFLLLREFTWTRLMMVIVGAINPISAIVWAGRREMAVILGLTFVLGLYFARRTAPPRWLTFGALAFAMLAIPATGIYRGLVAQGEIRKVRQIDLIANFKDYFRKESVLELRNGAAVIQSCQQSGRYEYGAGYWNQIVFRFVPAQLVGRDFKLSLMIGRSKLEQTEDATRFGHEFSVGSTLTGMGDSFKQFGWFGCLFFAGLAVVFRSFWLAALQPNALFAQLLYLLICSSAMRAVTHQTLDFLPGFIYQFAFLKLGLWYAGERTPMTRPGVPGQGQPTRSDGAPQRVRYQGRLY